MNDCSELNLMPSFSDMAQQPKMLKLSQNSVCETREVFHSSLTSSCWLLADKELLRVGPKVPSLWIQHKPTESCSPAHHQATGRAVLSRFPRVCRTLRFWLDGTKITGKIWCVIKFVRTKPKCISDWFKMWQWRPKLTMYTRCMIDTLIFFVRVFYCKQAPRKLLLSLREASSWVTLKKASHPQQLGLYFKYFSRTAWDSLFSAPRQSNMYYADSTPPPKKAVVYSKDKRNVRWQCFYPFSDSCLIRNSSKTICSLFSLKLAWFLWMCSDFSNTFEQTGDKRKKKGTARSGETACWPLWQTIMRFVTY